MGIKRKRGKKRRSTKMFLINIIIINNNNNTKSVCSTTLKFHVLKKRKTIFKIVATNKQCLIP
jgi:hypothetical protein